MSQRFDSVAEIWDAQQGPASARAPEFAARIGYLRTLCRDLHRPRVLDLGCGTGQTLLHIADGIALGIGIDVSPAMIARARRNAARTSLRFRVGNAADFCMNCRDQFELILLIGVLEHLPDQPAALAGISRVLTADGRLVVISPHPWNPMFRLKRLIDAGTMRRQRITHHRWSCDDSRCATAWSYVRRGRYRTRPGRSSIPCFPSAGVPKATGYDRIRLRGCCVAPLRRSSAAIAGTMVATGISR